jgi:hypothetical protein
VATWAEFADQAPDLAAMGADRLGQGVAYLATSSSDGSPRVHPVSPIVAQAMFIFMEPTSSKGRDLRRDGRYALHSAVDDAVGTGGEFFARGHARLVDQAATRQSASGAASFPPEDHYILFQLDIDKVLVTTYDDGVPVRTRWSESR